MQVFHNILFYLSFPWASLIGRALIKSYLWLILWCSSTLLDQNHTYIPMDGQTRQPEVETPTPEIMPQPIKEYD